MLRPWHGEAGAENGVGAESGFVVGPIEVEHDLVDDPLVERVESVERISDFSVDEADRVGDALAHVAVSSVAQLDGFVFAGRGAGRDRSATDCTRVEFDFDFHCRVAP